MVVGYSLGNRVDQEEEIPVVGEDDPDVITYSRSLAVPLTRTCRNDCPYCGFHRIDNLAVPYSSIKTAKAARERGAREALYEAGERPDKSPQIRATLDLWGFNSYLDYLYTVCELGFLEGLIGTIEVGFLTPQELKRLSEVCAMVKVMLDSVDKKQEAIIYKNSPGKKLETRIKNIEWAGKLRIPTSTGIMVGIGETKSHRKDCLNIIADLHKQYGQIHEVIIQNFVPETGAKFSIDKGPDKKTMLATVEMALNILPSDVSVIVPAALNPDIEDFIKAGIRDLGRLIEDPNRVFLHRKPVDFQQLNETVGKLGFRLQQRFPIRKRHIKEGNYSKKLGQVFDAYKYKIKKEDQEKQKEQKTPV